ncbi:MAG: MFS transporter [archaeon]|nr:MFS transporter [archaeon]
MSNEDNNKIVDRAQYWNPKYIWYNGFFYFFQGVYLMASQLYIFFMTQTHWKLGTLQIALFGTITGLPLFLKMFTGLLSDRVPWGKWGRRKPYIMMGTLLYIPAFLVFAFMRELNIIWIIAAILQAWLWVLVDGALDALACDVTPEEKMGTMNGLSGAGRCLGMVVGALFPIITSNIMGLDLDNNVGDWAQIIMIIGFFAFIMTLFGLLIKEPPVTKKDLIPLGKLFKGSFSKAQWLGFIFIFTLVACGGVTGALKASLRTFYDLNTAETAFFTLSYYSAGIGGSILAGKLLDKMGPKKGILITLILFWMSTIPWMFVNSESHIFVIYGVTAVIGLFDAMVFVCSSRTAMKLSNPELGGFMYSTFMSFHNLGGNIGLVTITAIAEALSLPYPFAWYLAIPYTIFAILLLPRMDSEERKF